MLKYSGDEALVNLIYNNITKNKCYLTNLAKATQEDARRLSDNIYRKYLNLLAQELDIIRPKIIITFGNQVSSIFLNKKLKVADCRKCYFYKTINNITYKVYPVYYPIGNGLRNIDKVIEDVNYILSEINK